MNVRKAVKKIMNRSADANHHPMLSTGAGPFNLACSGRVGKGLRAGRYYLLVGDSDAGKTMFGRTILAEAANDPNFKDYELLEENPEGGAEMDTRETFGNKLADRLKPLGGYDKAGRPNHATTLEQFYDRVDELLKKGVKFVLILDSQDVLACEAEIKKDDENRLKRRKGAKTAAASMGGGGRPAVHSARLRKIIPLLDKTGSILIIISQTRDKIGQPVFMKGPDKTRSGGNALTFYANTEIWTSIRERIKRYVEKNWVEIGKRIKVHVKRARLTGKDRTVEVIIYNTHGVDDVGSCVNYLIQWNHWEVKRDSKNRNKITSVTAPEFDFEGDPEKLVRMIEDMDAEKDLHKLVKKVWLKVESQLAVKRKRRYS